MLYDWFYCSGNTPAISVYQVYPGWGSHRVTRCLADPEAVADTMSATEKCDELDLATHATTGLAIKSCDHQP
jgi:hypothetical protein